MIPFANTVRICLDKRRAAAASLENTKIAKVRNSASHAWLVLQPWVMDDPKLMIVAVYQGLSTLAMQAICQGASVAEKKV